MSETFAINTINLNKIALSKSRVQWMLMEWFYHFISMSMQYTGNLNSCKKGQLSDAENVIFFLFFSQNVDCGYTLELPQ